MHRFEYFEPATLAEAVALLGRGNGKASLLAGGTDLLVEIKEHLRRPDYVINIKQIPGMEALSYDPERGLRFGALVTSRAIELSPVVQEKYPGLAQAARDLG
ncbi:MAG: FAD binding domain-containing protein, partial [Burkholderiales bacterium]